MVPRFVERPAAGSAFKVPLSAWMSGERVAEPAPVERGSLRVVFIRVSGRISLDITVSHAGGQGRDARSPTLWI